MVEFPVMLWVRCFWISHAEPFVVLPVAYEVVTALV